MKVALKDVHPNPFRDTNNYPIKPQKILQLKASIQSTEFWENVVARKRAGGGIEIAYGHHRLTALREMYSPDTTFNWIVKDLDDADMIKIMAMENMEEWGHDASIELETVRAVVLAYGDDKIGLSSPNKKTRDNQLRHAPGFCFENQINKLCAGSNPAHIKRTHPYTSETVKEFLGRTMSIEKVKSSLQALCMIERGFLKYEDLSGLTPPQCRTLVTETEKSIRFAEHVKKEAERKSKAEAPTPAIANAMIKEANQTAEKIIKTTTSSVAKAVHEGTNKAKEAATKARVGSNPKAKELPEIDKAARSIAYQIESYLDPYKSGGTGAKISLVIEHKNHMSTETKIELDRSLETLIEYAQGYRAGLK